MKKTDRERMVEYETAVKRKEEEKEEKKLEIIKARIWKRGERSGRDGIIKFYAEHYHYPMSDFRGFNKMLKEQFGFKTTKKKLAKILEY